MGSNALVTRIVHGLVRFSLAFAVIPVFNHRADAEDQVDLGRELFIHKWTANDLLSPGGDGLGPMHNADSCVACHHLGGIGGAGLSGSNVDLLSIVFSGEERTRSQESLIDQRARKVHPGFFGNSGKSSSTVLHRFDTEPGYEAWRAAIQGFKLPPDLKSHQAAITLRAMRRKQSSRPPVTQLSRKNGVPLHLSQRNTPALFGIGAIDSISEKTLLEVAAQQAQRFPGIQGRLPRTASGRLGRFGWRGQVATLPEFVLSACATELGLQNRDHPQAINPLNPSQKLVGNDLTSDQCNALIAFVASLPAPQQISPTSLEQANLLSQGEGLFATVGCAGCHPRDLGSIRGIFSDQLLHDMGPELEDPVAAFPERVKVGTVAGPSSGYGGGGTVDRFADLQTPIRREWKTPPLWGARDSAPYLHDGRAATLIAAIAAHGGQAEASRRRFEELGDPEKSTVLTFLQSLAGPGPEAN